MKGGEGLQAMNFRLRMQLKNLRLHIQRKVSEGCLARQKFEILSKTPSLLLLEAPSSPYRQGVGFSIDPGRTLLP